MQLAACKLGRLKLTKESSAGQLAEALFMQADDVVMATGWCTVLEVGGSEGAACTSRG